MDNNTQTTTQNNATDLESVEDRRCLACDYRGEEIICPACKMITELTCLNCNQPESLCICEKLASDQQPENLSVNS